MKKKLPFFERKPPLTIAMILAWADEYYERVGRWPTRDSGKIAGVLGLTWCAVDNALRVGTRGLNKGSSLAKLLAERRGHRHHFMTPGLSIRLILAWADAYKARTGDWPTKHSGKIVDAPGETWSAIDRALYTATRGISRPTTLAALLALKRHRHSQRHRPLLTEDQIVRWAEAYHTLYGAWPITTTGPIGNTGETWLRVNAALRNGGRGLPGGSSLFQLLKSRGKFAASRTPFHRVTPVDSTRL